MGPRDWFVIHESRTLNSNSKLYNKKRKMFYLRQKTFYSGSNLEH